MIAAYSVAAAATEAAAAAVQLLLESLKVSEKNPSEMLPSLMIKVWKDDFILRHLKKYTVLIIECNMFFFKYNFGSLLL